MDTDVLQTDHSWVQTSLWHDKDAVAAKRTLESLQPSRKMRLLEPMAFSAAAVACMGALAVALQVPLLSTGCKSARCIHASLLESLTLS